jgi:hypothetical protein
MNDRRVKHSFRRENYSERRADVAALLLALTTNPEFAASFRMVAIWRAIQNKTTNSYVIEIERQLMTS